MLSRFPLAPCALALVFSALSGTALAQATVKDDGRWRYALGAGASFSSGNSESSSVTLTGEAVRATNDSKWGIGGRALQSRSEGQTTADNAALGTQYDQNFSDRLFGFGKLDYLRDQPANLDYRASGSVGVGKHVVRAETTTWDVSVGLGYAKDQYASPSPVAGQLRDSYGRAELVLGEESTHKFSQTTSFRQKLGLFANLQRGSEYRAVFDAGLSVAMTDALSLTAGLTYRYDSAPTLNLNNSDLLFVTGISVKLD
jgi:putative salt-induced outer membrane protein